MEISKEYAAKYLRNTGYDADVVNGVVTVFIDESKVVDLQAGKILRKVRKALTAIGYSASYGVKVKSEKTNNG